MESKIPGVSPPLGAAVDLEHPPTPPTRAKYKFIGLSVGIGILVMIPGVIVSILADFLYVGIAVMLAPLFVVLVVFYYCWRRRYKALGRASRASNAQLSPGSAYPLLLIDPGPRKFTYEELEKATSGFSPANFLGRGGFGDVHKGVLLSGEQVAVKKLNAGSTQGVREFQTEVEIISRVHHRHLVSLVGYCISGTQMMLVYEFVPNNTLKCHLHGEGRPAMSWETRMKIALGSAKGLAYLHEDCKPKIIHRDIKAANILLDNNFVAKVADFGLARCFADDDTHVSTQVKGTHGYVDPDYVSSKKLTDKSDVYSFGVVLLELITGHRPMYETQSSEKENHPCPLVGWARPLLKQALEGGNIDTLVDQRLEGRYESSEMARMVACADACVRQPGVLRPRMSQIFQVLEGNIPLDNLK